MAIVNIGGRIGLSQKVANLDNKYGPYTSLQEAYDVLGPDDLDVLAIGLTVGIQATSTAPIEEYWFKNACNSVNDLVPKKSTKTSDLVNDSDFQNEDQVNAAIQTAIYDVLGGSY